MTRATGFKVLRDRLRTIFEPASLRVVATAALERRQAERIVGKLTGEPAPALAAMSRDELFGSLAVAFFDKDRVVRDLASELDRATRSERSLVRSIDETVAGERLSSLKALRLRRHGAKLVWALATDHREVVWSLAEAVLREYLEQTEILDSARAAARRKGAEEELRELETLYGDAAQQAIQEFSAVERERARLIAEIGRREAQLRDEIDRRQALRRELDARRDPPQVASPSTSKVRKLEKRLGALERENDDLRALTECAAELEEDNTRLRRTVEALREQRAMSCAKKPVELPTSETVPGSPLVEPPRRRRARQRNDQSDQRVGVFLDVANLAGAARRVHDGAVDFAALLQLAVGHRRLAGAHAFTIDKGSDGYADFAHALRQAGYRVFTKKPKTFGDGTVKADWDVGIAVELLTAVDRFDVVVLGSGDGDFVPVVNALKNRGVRVEVYAFAERTAPELERVADAFVRLDTANLQ